MFFFPKYIITLQAQLDTWSNDPSFPLPPAAPGGICPIIVGRLRP